MIGHLPTLMLISLALVMLGVGLSLSWAEFLRLREHPRAVVLALGLQMLLLPAIAWGLALAFGLSPVFAVGLMLLAASPGGVTANLFSHLFGGHVALNLSLTAINTLLSVVTMPLIANLALQHFIGEGVVPLQTKKVVEVMAVVLVPVALGMGFAKAQPGLAARLQKPFKIFSALVLALLAIGAIAKEWNALVDSASSIGAAVLVFNLLSLGMGYWASRWAGLDKPMALPAAAYSVTMYALGVVFGLLLRRLN